MLQMIKKFHFTILLTIFFISFPILADDILPHLRTKVFLYQSKLPSNLLSSEEELRRHVIDVLLSTQKYNVVFSKIPEFIAKGDVSQVILKYKIRTSSSFSNLYNIEFKLINVDTIKVVKTISYIDIPKTKILYQFRLHLYEFILGKKLTNEQEINLNKISESKIEKFKMPLEDSTKNLGNEKNSNKNFKNNQILKNSFGKAAPEKNNTITNNNTSMTPTNPTVPPKKISLWDLLLDNDEDSSWTPKIENVGLVKKNEESKDSVKKSEDLDLEEIEGPPNPFLKTRISIKENEAEDSRFDMFHVAWRIVKREQEVTDLVGLTNNFFSILGFTFEWVIHHPLNIKNIYFRTGFEFDKSLKTEPIKLSDHSLFRTGLGVKLPFNLLPSLYIETNSLVFANLNRVGGGFEDNIVSVYWSTLELALLTESLYLAIQYSKSIDSSTLLKGINFANLQGERLGVNARYFSNYSIFSLKLWSDVEYRIERFDANNLDFIDRKLNIVKMELAIRFGVYF